MLCFYGLKKNSKIRKEHILNLLNEPEIKISLNNSGGLLKNLEFCERLKEVAKISINYYL